ncbi:Phospholipase A2 group III [Carabus blaptoides fortunei]
MSKVLRSLQPSLPDSFVYHWSVGCVSYGLATGRIQCHVCRLVLAVATAVLAAAAATTAFTTSTDSALTDFIVYNTLEDGEQETRIHYKNLTAKEVAVGVRSGIKFRQLTDGKHFIQLIYDEDDVISDCEYLHEKQSVLSFLDSFRSDVNLLTTMYNATIVALDRGHLPKDMRKWMNYKKLRDQCEKKHQELKKMLKSRGRSAPEDISSRTGRSRRDIVDYLLVPGTKWCGKGHKASKYTDVGMFSTTDKCCRRHDSACPFWIAGFDTKYRLFNWRVNTIMHCQCDERFRACLKRVGTSDANLVGKLFFNVVQTKCFVFKAKKTCVQRSWWGKCQKRKLEKMAILRNNMPY